MFYKYQEILAIVFLVVVIKREFKLVDNIHGNTDDSIYREKPISPV